MGATCVDAAGAITGWCTCSSSAALRELLKEGLIGGPQKLRLRDVCDAADAKACFDLLAAEDGRCLKSLPLGAALRLQHCSLDVRSIEALGAALRFCDDSSGGHEDIPPDESAGAGYDAFDLFAEDIAPELFVAEGTHISPATASTSLPTTQLVQRLSRFAITCCPSDVPSPAWLPLWQAIPAGLKELDFSCNALSDPAIGALCGGLKGRRCPRRLILCENNCKDIARMCDLIEAGGLEELDLADNQLNDKSVAQIVEALASPSCTLQRLRLSGNKKVTSKGVMQLLPCLESGACTLVELWLDRTAVCDVGAAALAGAICRGTCLQDLRLQLSNATSSGARALLAAAQEGQRMRRLIVDDDAECVRWNAVGKMAEICDVHSCAAAVDIEERRHEDDF
eukprot:TRINITY_DN13533_c0_g2_i1.p1 TRINITY_DN13533_c0_g2~~TRINITY_DN13533_c0_g2_i1.p1  ORF type:complete len:418 (+),score=71.06 TRINITY_DN13533_c0_g2_i1:66-1256(+)